MKPTAANRSGGNRLGFLAFGLDEGEFAVELDAIREIVMPPPLTPVPRSGPGIEGVVAIRGQVVTVVDLRTLLGLSPSLWPRSARLLLIDFQGEPLAVLIDQVGGVYNFLADRLEPATELEGAARGEYVRALARTDGGRIVTILDLPRLLAENL